MSHFCFSFPVLSQPDTRRIFFQGRRGKSVFPERDGERKARRKIQAALYVLFFCAFLFLSCGRADAKNQETVYIGAGRYALSEKEGTASCVGYAAYSSGKKEYILFPSFTYEGVSYTVTSIGNEAFKGKTLETVKIPSTVRSIGESAFEDCKNLAEVKGCEGLESIGKGAFRGCSSLKSMEGCEKVKEIQAEAFRECRKLRSVGSSSNTISLPSVRGIGKRAFYLCTALKSVNLSCGDSLSVGASAFAFCPFLREFSSLSRDMEIGKYAFYADQRLDSITLKAKKLSVGTKAFKGVKGTSPRFPSGKRSSFKKLLQSRGLGNVKSRYRKICAGEKGIKSSKVREMNQSLKKLPYWMTQLFVNSEYSIVITHSLFDKGEKVQGMASYGEKILYLNEDCSDETPIHEMGHWYDYEIGKMSGNDGFLSGGEEFMAAYEKEKKTYYKKVYSRGSKEVNTPTETFASVFSDYYYSSETRRKLRENCPCLYQYMRDIDRMRII